MRSVTPALPACCHALRHDWLLPLPLPAVRLASCNFTPERLQDDDPVHLGLTLPDALQTAAAKRRCEYLAGRVCAAAALQQLGGGWQYPPRGSDRAPRWPHGYSGSLTHSHGWAVAVVAHGHHWRSLGVDAERQIAPERAARLARQILVEEEIAHFNRQDPGAAAEYLTLCFSLKESLFKALYPLVGRHFTFSAAAVHLHAAPGQASLELRESLHRDWPRGRSLAGQFARRGEHRLSLIAIAAD
ncbi:4'-phosphopantetheinyl transferase superfamily protein [Pseudomonas sp. NW5]|uniref:4'-phosphopantetheinyl transferase family protein n=1 Tax=Pseudomonas sp. NW5 TaxID=2934934 RepID=UPI0020206BC2|nr:4'-phosphopantetheinyl transferase superfamily protein [Pseudomonas sp. NW5]MCL7462061.1 4'-phosphopantetheinyl transferase superfamily protein [Pseudomonas sp. NW5]